MYCGFVDTNQFPTTTVLAEFLKILLTVSIFPGRVAARNILPMWTNARRAIVPTRLRAGGFAVRPTLSEGVDGLSADFDDEGEPYRFVVIAQAVLSLRLRESSMAWRSSAERVVQV